MRDIKIVAYLAAVDDHDEELIWDYLLNKGVILNSEMVPRMTFYSVDNQMKRKDRVIAEQNIIIEAYADRLKELEDD